MVPASTIANLPQIVSPIGQLTLPTPIVHPSSPLYAAALCPALCTTPVPPGEVSFLYKVMLFSKILVENLQILIIN